MLKQVSLYYSTQGGKIYKVGCELYKKSLKNNESHLKCAEFDAESNGPIFAVLILGQKICGQNY